MLQRTSFELALPRTRMVLTTFALLLVTLVTGSLVTETQALAQEPIFARLETETGDILLVFYPELAPNHVNNFVHLSRKGFFDGTKFHRIVPGFVIQGGDPNSKDADPRNDGMGGPTIADILDEKGQEQMEALNATLAERGYLGMGGEANLKAEFSDIKHVRGSLSMARSREVDSAGSQFFICVENTPQLDGQYTLFGQVVTGMEVADAIVSAEKNPAAGRDAPRDPVAITKVTIIEGTESLLDVEREAWEAMPADLKTKK